MTSNKNIVEKKKHGKRWKNYIIHNFIHFFGATVKLYNEDIANRWVVFRIKNSKDHGWLKKIKQSHDGKTSAIAKFQNLIGKAMFVRPGKVFMSYLCTKLHPYLQNKQNCLISLMSVEVPVSEVPQENCKCFWYF